MLAVQLKMINSQGLAVKVVRRPLTGESETEIHSTDGNNQRTWTMEKFSLGSSVNNSKLLLELTRSPNSSILTDSYVAIKRISLNDCLASESREPQENCAIKCSLNNKCITKDEICDLEPNCPDGEDEKQDCDKLPKGAYCSFNNGDFCDWFLNSNQQSNGILSSDGGTLLLKMRSKFLAKFHIISPKFSSIPYYNSLSSSYYHKSCRMRFRHQFENRALKFYLSVLKEDPASSSGHPQNFENPEIKNKINGLEWRRAVIPLPTFHSLSYNVSIDISQIQILGKSISLRIDNVSLSKECFGIGVPLSEPRDPPVSVSKFTLVEKSKDLRIPRAGNLTSFEFNSCGISGRMGPRLADCLSHYTNTSLASINVSEDKDAFPGAQMWTIPKTGTYSIFAKGASGGRSQNIIGGQGDLVSAVFTLSEGETVFVLVGQSGEDSCPSTLSSEELTKCLRAGGPLSKGNLPMGLGYGSGGGGGGASYVFKFDRMNHRPVPLIIAAGGGGAGRYPRGPQNGIRHGEDALGLVEGIKPANGQGKSGGGGWTERQPEHSVTQGSPLRLAAYGGSGCNENSKIYGGFGGGGGGGCRFGGGGGGYVGGTSGDAQPEATISLVESDLNGKRGAISYVNTNLATMRFLGANVSGASTDSRNGVVAIFPQIDDCCDDRRYPCVVVGQHGESGPLITMCICDSEIAPDSCEKLTSVLGNQFLDMALVIIITFLVVLIMFLLFRKYKIKQSSRCHNSSSHCNRDESASQLLSQSSTDVQLSRLRSGHNIVTEFNPNYEFGGSTCTLADLRDISREKLNLVKALGQGAFGEVYQGYLLDTSEETSDEVAVAVKTLPEHSANNQAEMDFLMEALIMSKFKHRNIVRFIGVCFEKMPRFIVLELLPGGDLKTFLRESRATLNRPSPLYMGDLLVVALDVARGCQYLEDNHFIHRDIAARNCLLTSKIKMSSSNGNYVTDGVFKMENYNNGFNNSGIIVKIADFGMARDIYRSDYYRKGGKAMLPVKWMPPEAFLDGIFTSKTDVWSFGVLLWEVMSMGFMPYPGRGNQEVMQLVTAGGRLEPPNNACPSQIFAIMQQCWQAVPEMRPNFATIIERLGYCLVDPDVLSRKLAIFHRAPSSERDATIMRPPPDSTDYLVPTACSNSNSNYSISTEKTELLSPDTCSTITSNHEDTLKSLDDEQKNPLLPPRRPEKMANHSAYRPNPIRQDTDSSVNSLILNPESLNSHHAPNRYVNVEMKDVSNQSHAHENV
ncbi:leukocyte tyrosine kinase receptor-like isoform X2 [Brevipalpus obovatus]